ncbi:MAG: adenylosuccinate lyase [Myxococcales bacterium]|nr:adenylosuccinate lyase [Myxococcales bacterium]
MSTFGHDTWLSPFTYRYGSPEMRKVWSMEHQRRIWRRIWIALADAQREVGLVTAEQVEDLRAHRDAVDLERSHAIEAEIRHDVMAEVKAFAEQCAIGGGIVHLGATSMDVQDNADAVRLGEALDLLVARVASLGTALAAKIEIHADDPTMAFTHLQPAEPTTTGYRLAQTGQDLLADLQALRALRAGLVGKGFKGAAGTSASYAQLLAGTGWTTHRFEAAVMAPLGIRAAQVATQTVPRKQEYTVLAGLASLGQTLYKFAFDLRILQSPVIGEWAEPFGAKQVGSSAMPFKRNPIDAENMDSLARHLAALPRVAWDNAAHSLLERTLDDSANRRSVLPEAFLMADELVKKARKLVDGLRVDEGASRRLMDVYGPFAATERLLMEAVKRGGDRQALHEVIREHSLKAWEQIRLGMGNPLEHELSRDPVMLGLMSDVEIRAHLVAHDYVGDAPVRARTLAAALRRASEEGA